jgi:hypothetical protein
MKAFAVSASFAPDTENAWITVGGMISAGNSPPSAAPVTGNISLIKVTPRVGLPDRHRLRDVRSGTRNEFDARP